MPIEIRVAKAADAASLTDLAMRAKASWGYDADFMAACRSELTITPERLTAWRTWVAEIDGQLAGMIALHLVGGAAPNAEAIYARLGFRTIGRSPSGSIPGRTLPRMKRFLSCSSR